jgi:peptidoglycan hydrolase-like protein with peptidoglycan-binding domain
VSGIAETPRVTTIGSPLKVTTRFNFVIRRLLLRLCAVAAFLAIVPAHSGADISKVQSKLKDMGLFYGQVDGGWGDETSAAVTRYQIREGLEINGQLNGETLQSLGMAKDGPPVADQPRGDAWKILRQQDVDAVEEPTEGAPDVPPSAETHEDLREPPTIVSVPSPAPKTSLIPPDTSPAPSVEATPRPTAVPPRVEPTPLRAEAVPPRAEAVPPRAEAVPPRAEAVPPRAPYSPGTISPDRLRYYIAAYVLAGLAPSAEPELEFFADRVDYFGDVVGKEVIRRDLEQYNAKYPDRRFWLAGDPQIESETDKTIRVNFPLRFDVSGPSGSKSGKVLKRVELRKTGHTLEIIAVDESRAK